MVLSSTVVTALVAASPVVLNCTCPLSLLPREVAHVPRSLIKLTRMAPPNRSAKCVSMKPSRPASVSYTHLTLPTKRIV